jgi:hypothetical protein
VQQSGASWKLLAGDAYFHHREMDAARPWCTPGLRMYQTLMEKHRSLRLANQARLRALARQQAGEVQVFCAHDPVEFERITGQSISQPLHRPALQA